MQVLMSYHLTDLAIIWEPCLISVKLVLTYLDRITHLDARVSVVFSKAGILKWHYYMYIKFKCGIESTLQDIFIVLNYQVMYCWLSKDDFISNMKILKLFTDLYACSYIH